MLLPLVMVGDLQPDDGCRTHAVFARIPVAERSRRGNVLNMQLWETSQLIFRGRRRTTMFAGSDVGGQRIHEGAGGVDNTRAVGQSHMTAAAMRPVSTRHDKQATVLHHELGLAPVLVGIGRAEACREAQQE